MSENHPVEKLDKMQAEKELIRLNEILDRANSDYYSNDAPILSDAEYDTLKKRNLDIESRFPNLKYHILEIYIFRQLEQEVRLALLV